jgi:hypothetical protein
MNSTRFDSVTLSERDSQSVTECLIGLPELLFGGSQCHAGVPDTCPAFLFQAVAIAPWLHFFDPPFLPEDLFEEIAFVVI